MSVRRQKTAAQGTRWDYFALVIVMTPWGCLSCQRVITVVQLYKDALNLSLGIFQTKLSPTEFQELTLEMNRIQLI